MSHRDLAGVAVVLLLLAYCLHGGLFRKDTQRDEKLNRLIVTSATYRQASHLTSASREKDPDNILLARGPRVRLDAGAYSGEYLVADTGTLVRGKRIDIWTPTSREAMRFGRRTVKLEPGTLLVIAKHEPHEIKSSARSRLVTMNLYVPAAYDAHGEPLRG